MTRQKEPGSTQWIPNKEKNRHREVPLVTPNGEVVGVDEGISELIFTMWGKGLETQFSCEGYHWNHPEDGTEHSWSAEQYRAYILMPWTPKTSEFVLDLQKKFFRFDGEMALSWSFDYHTTRHFGGMNRICMRFPKGDIAHLEKFVAYEYQF